MFRSGDGFCWRCFIVLVMICATGCSGESYYTLKIGNTIFSWLYLVEKFECFEVSIYSLWKSCLFTMGVIYCSVAGCFILWFFVCVHIWKSSGIETRIKTTVNYLPVKRPTFEYGQMIEIHRNFFSTFSIQIILSQTVTIIIPRSGPVVYWVQGP